MEKRSRAADSKMTQFGESTFKMGITEIQFDKV